MCLTQMDLDPSDLNKLKEKRKWIRFVFSSRYIKGAGTEDDTFNEYW